MVKITLTRIKYDDDCTLGILDYGWDKVYTLEKPWRNNDKNISCIPEGFYTFRPHGWKNENLKYKNVWQIENVEDRTAILIHAGNRVHETEGCILVGQGLHTVGADQYLVNSKKALNDLRSVLGANCGIIEVKSL